ALRRLATSATYLYQEGSRVWYDTQPNVTKTAEERAELLKRDSDKVSAELETRIRHNAGANGEFARVHSFPRSAAHVPHGRATTPAPPASSRACIPFRAVPPMCWMNTPRDWSSCRPSIPM